MIINLLEYKALPGHEAELTGFLRHVALPSQPPEGLILRFAGRRLSSQGRKHLVATAWHDADALARNTDDRGMPAYLSEKCALFSDVVTSQYRVVASAGLGRQGAKVLRLNRTSIPVDAIETWEKGARETLGRLIPKLGLLVALAGIETAGDEVLSIDGEARVVALTAWTEWDVLLAATGGRLDRSLLDAELNDLEKPARPDHFELLQSEPGPA